MPFLCDTPSKKSINKTDIQKRKLISQADHDSGNEIISKLSTYHLVGARSKVSYNKASVEQKCWIHPLTIKSTNSCRSKNTSIQSLEGLSPTKNESPGGQNEDYFSQDAFFTLVHGRSDEVRRLHRTGSRAALEFCPSVVLSMAAHFLVFVCSYFWKLPLHLHCLWLRNHPPFAPVAGRMERN
ncbi:hypothetical protein CEXT_600821 [Caerostris extrusa]|uniref:Uncharacterized protein n=1 Tax=Caerostris extrusa TaxID=172846 RepID=A0AAV4XFT1_CAEEX|nr:hypothetical protein CEXT_600821 [Caerostris extrusa]